jgi:hypothetical protein
MKAKPWVYAHLTDGARFARAVEMARQHIPIMKQVVAEEAWSGLTIAEVNGEYCVYDNSAWTEPSVRPMLPWSPPTAKPVAKVDMDGKVTTLWVDEGVCVGGTVGGDGAGEAVTRRFTKRRADGTFAVVDSAYYPVNIGERWGDDRDDAAAFDVENMNCLTICTDLDDPGMTEVWSETFFAFPSATSFATEDEATEYCTNMATNRESSDYYGDPDRWGTT